MLKVARWIVFWIAVLAMNFPVLVTLITSLKSAGELSVNPGLWVRAPTLANYFEVLSRTDRFNIYAYLWNSLVASAVGTGVAVLLALPAAYAIARSDVGKRLMLPLVINLRVVPLIIFAIPLYVMYQWLGLLDTRLGLGLILAIVNIPLTLVILVNAISDVSVELDEAAKVDGANSWHVLTRILRPVVRPALATTFIFGFITAWNEFLFGLMLTTAKAVPVTVGASFFFAASGGGVQWGTASAVMMLGALPPVVLGMLSYRRISGSMTAGALKG